MRGILVVTVGMLLGISNLAAAQSWQPPSESQRCPSKWGAADERGSGNHMNPETVLRAMRLVKAGEIFESVTCCRRRCPSQRGGDLISTPSGAARIRAETGAGPMKSWSSLKSDKSGHSSTPSAIR